MRIAVNTRMLLKHKLEGIGRFTYEVTKRMVQQHPDVEFHFLFDRKYNGEFIFGKNVVPHILLPPARHPLLWYVWFEHSVPFMLKKINADAFVSADGYLSLQATTPTHLTIHDLAFEHFPDAVPFLVKKYYRHFVPKYANAAAQIATVSSFSKQDMMQQYGINENKIDVVYNAASNYFKPMSYENKLLIKKNISNGAPYFICVSSIHPRKNIVNLLLAFDAFKNTDLHHFKLVLVGDFMFGKNEVMDTLAKLKHPESIIRTGSLPHQKIAELQAAAEATLYISLFEGFGIPIIESMQSGVPVITSNCSSMPEVSADAALLVNPTDINAIEKALKKISTDKLLHEQLIEKGLKRSEFFSWDKTANNYWVSVLKAIEKK